MAEPPRAAAGRAANATAPCLWLHACDKHAGAVLSVLAQQLAQQPDAPTFVLAGDAGSGLGGDAGDAAEIDAFLHEHAPQALVLAGQPLPRALIERARAEGLGLFLVDASGPAERGLRLPWPMGRGRLLRHFTQIHARDARAAEALSRLAGRAVVVQTSGEMARFGPAPACSRAAIDALRASIGGRPAWFAHSLPLSEARAALAAHVHALRFSHRLLLIIGPAEPDACAALTERAADAGLIASRGDLGEEPGEATQIHIAKATDKPGLFLRLAQICYLGGGLTPGAPTPAPAPASALGAALIHGPYGRGADQALLQRLQRAGAARGIGAAAQLGPAVAHFLQPETMALAALSAWKILSEGSDATERVAQALRDWCQAQAAAPKAGAKGDEA